MSISLDDHERITKIKLLVGELNSEVRLLPSNVRVEYHLLETRPLGSLPINSVSITILEEL